MKQLIPQCTYSVKLKHILTGSILMLNFVLLLFFDSITGRACVTGVLSNLTSIFPDIGDTDCTSENTSMIRVQLPSLSADKHLKSK